MSISSSRLLTELESFRTNRKYMFYARPTKDMKTWEAGFPGPNTPLYKGSYFKISMKFCDQYPFRPPQVKFINKMYHPNIYSDGNVCFTLFSTRWKPSLNISDILIGLQQLLAQPNPNSPANCTAAGKFKKSKKAYEKCVIENIQKNHTKVPWDDL